VVTCSLRGAAKMLRKIVMLTIGSLIIFGSFYFACPKKYLDLKIINLKLDKSRLTIEYELKNRCFKKYYLHEPKSAYQVDIRDGTLKLIFSVPIDLDQRVIQIYGFAVPQVQKIPPFGSVNGKIILENNYNKNYKEFRQVEISLVVLKKELKQNMDLLQYNKFLNDYGQRVSAIYPLSGSYAIREKNVGP
jgi:hypothetical protein